MQPTPRSLVLFGTMVALSVAWTVVVGEWWLMGVALPLTALLALGVDAALAPGPRQVAVEVTAPDLVAVGQPAQVALVIAAIRNVGAGRCTALCEVTGPLQTPAIAELDWRSGVESRVEWPLLSLGRGEGRLERAWLRWTGPFGLMAVHARYPIDRSIAITPDVSAVQAMALKFFQRDALFGQKPMRQQGEGSEFRALREYVPGLDPRAIDWKQSAKHRNLMCKEFYTERNQQIVFAVDCGRLMSEPLDSVPRLDHAINASLLMCYTSLRYGDRVGVFSFDARVRAYARPVGNVTSFPLVRREMARLRYHPEETNYTLGLMDLLGRLDRRSLIVVMTDFVDTVTAELMLENLQRLSARHLVLFVTLRDRALSRLAARPPATLTDLARSVFAQDFVSERDVVMQRLRRLGVRCLDVDPDRLGPELINAYLDIKRRDLL